MEYLRKILGEHVLMMICEMVHHGKMLEINDIYKVMNRTNTASSINYQGLVLFIEEKMGDGRRIYETYFSSRDFRSQMFNHSGIENKMKLSFKGKRFNLPKRYVYSSGLENLNGYKE